MQCSSMQGLCAQITGVYISLLSLSLSLSIYIYIYIYICSVAVCRASMVD